jgi:hypothetical protein
METNNIFSLKRFMTLCRQSAGVNKKMIGISLAGVTGAMFVLLLFFQSMGHFEYWGKYAYFSSFIFFFLFIGVIYSGLSFSSFRTKEKSISYLMLPVSTLEKYLFEFLSRLVAFVLLMPLLYWAIANLEGAVIHHYFPDLTNFKFSFRQSLTGIIKKEAWTGWLMLSYIQGGLFVLIAAFTGACHFSKSPLIKTLFTFSLIAGGYALLTYLLFKGLDIKNYTPAERGVLFIHKKEDFIAFFAVAATVVNLSLLAIAWFRLKEKEV